MRVPSRLQIDNRVATPLPLLLLTLLLVVPASPALGQSLVFSSNTLSVAEGATQTYTLKLATQPSADVKVQIRSLDKGAATALPLRMTFTTANWDTAQTVTVSGVADPDRVAETVTLKHRASGGDYDNVTGDVTASVTDAAGFTLSCGSTVAEDATLTCTLSNPGSSATPWPGVAIFHLSEDADRALVRGGDVDVEFDTLTPAASTAFDQELEGGVWWVGRVLVAYERFDWSGNAAASASRSIPIMALDDELHEGDEQFYITLTPDGTRNATALYYDTHKQTITVTDTDTAGTDTSLASLDVRAPGAASALSTTLSGTSYTASVDYEVSEVVVTPTATHHAATIVVGSDEEEVESGGTSSIFQLTAGTTTSITVTVTAEDGTSTQTYTITLTRAAKTTTVTVATDSFSLECPSQGREGTTLSCTLTNTGSSPEKFPVVALIHSSLDDDLATVAEDSILPASDSAYRDDVSFPAAVRTSSNSEYTYGYGELFSGGSEEYVTYGYEKFTRTDDEDTTATEDEVAAGATQTVSIEPQSDTVDESAEQFYVGLAPAGYTGLKQLVANKVPLLILSPVPTAPAFAASTTRRSVVENTPADQPIGEPVAATDADGDDLTYSLGGTDVAAFDIDTASGQLKTKAALNHAIKSSYSVTVSVTDGEDADGAEETIATIDATITVTITVSDVNEPPVVSGDSSVTVSYDEHDMGVVYTFSATDPEGDTLTWTPTGDDAGAFTITAGALSFRTAPDFEAPADAGGDNIYMVTVQVTDDKNAAHETDTTVDATVAVTVTVTNINEVGAVTLDVTQPQVGRGMTAMLIDPDGGLSIIWTWERSASNTGPWTEITPVVSSSSYTPVAIDGSLYLRVSATYTDSYGRPTATSEPVQVLPLPTVSLELSPDEIAESGTGNSTTVRARLSRISPAQTSVTVTAGAGVTVSGNPLTIIAGSLTSTDPVTLTAEDNNVHGPASKEVTVSGNATNSDGVTGPATVELTITDDDEPPMVTLALSPIKINESGTGNSATVTASLPTTSSVSSGAIELTVAATPVEPATAADFMPSSTTTLTIPAEGRTSSGTVTLTATDDAIDEPDETVSVGATVTQGTATAPAAVLLTIADTDNPPTLTLILTPASISENGGVSRVTATLSHASSAAITVTVSAEPTGSATAADFTPSGTTLTFPAGDKTSPDTVTLTAENNDIDTPDKTVTVTGEVDSYGLPGTIASATKTLTIKDDDAPVVTLALSNSTIDEGETVTVRATLSHESIADITVMLSAAAVDPATAADFTLSGNTLTFKVGDKTSTGEVTLTAVNDAVDGPETKEVTVTGTGPTDRSDITVARPVTLTITDNDTRGVKLEAEEQPIPAAGLSITEGDTGRYTVVLESQPTDTVEIAVASDDTAVHVSPTPLTFTKSDWKTARTVTIHTEDDADGEDLEARITHTVTGGDYEANNVPAADVAVTVTDDESPSTGANLSVSPTEVGEGAGRTVRVTATLNRAVLKQATEVTVSVTSGTAVSDTDFAAVQDFPLTIAANTKSGSATFTLTPVNDDIDEPNETVTVSGTAAALADGVIAATLTITDNDNPPTLDRLELEAEEDRIEESGETTTLTAVLSNPSSVETVVGLTVLDGAEAVELSASELTIPAGEPSGTVTLTGVDKPGYGSHRPVTLRGRVTSPASTVQHDVTLTVLDDDPPTVGGKAEVNVIEGNREVDTYTAADPAGVRLVWAVDDPSAFAIDSNGRLRFQADPDHETQPSYSVTVEATDRSLPDVPLTGSLAVTVTVQDAPGKVSLSPASPQVGRVLTATVTDPDEVKEVTEWCWERSDFSDFHAETDALSCTTSGLTTTATYVPGNAEVNHYLRAMASYTDRAETTKSKPVAGVSDNQVTARPPPPPQTRPTPSRGGGGGGGGGGEIRDDHGNMPAQATRVVLNAARTASTPGQFHAPDDVDYFEVLLPQAGLLAVETRGSTDTVGTVWQGGAMLARADRGGEGQNFRLRTPVTAAPVLVAVEGQGGTTGAYTLEARLLNGYLENPGVASSQSGLGLISGWVCDADLVEIEIGDFLPQAAAYGTERLDTAGVCGDTDNGFGLLFNWNLLGDGAHTVVAYVDGVELGRATVRVTTLGAEFLREAEGECVVEDFPAMGRTVTLEWQQTSQNFVIAGGSAPARAHTGTRPSGLTGYLENPGPNSFQSGIGVLSGWVCEGAEVIIELNGEPQPAAYGTERLDTLDACGDTDNGFGLLFNWNLLGDGAHTVVALVDGMELGRATVQVTTLGVEFLRDVEGECVVEDFPMLGETVLLEWQQNSQNFVITDVE